MGCVLSIKDIMRDLIFLSKDGSQFYGSWNFLSRIFFFMWFHKTNAFQYCFSAYTLSDLNISWSLKPNWHLEMWVLMLVILFCQGYTLLTPEELNNAQFILSLIVNQSDSLKYLVEWLYTISKIQLVVYHQCCILIGWATSRLYVIAH